MMIDIERNGMIKEVYRLALTHYAVDDDFTKTPLDEPIVIEQIFDRRFGGSPIILNRMLDEMRVMLLEKKKIEDFNFSL